MITFIVIVFVDLISEDTNIPWWVQGIVLALGSSDYLFKRFRKPKRVELPDGFWADLQEAYEKRLT